MTQTLRRELRKAFEEVLHKGALWTKDKLADALADAALEVSAIAKRAELVKAGGIQWAVVAGEKVTQEMADAARVRQEAPIEFERALGFSKPLPWTVDKDWQNFAEWVVEKYQSDPKVFQRYETWRSQPFVRGAIDNKRLRGFVHEFYDSFDMFKKQDKPDSAQVREPGKGFYA